MDQQLVDHEKARRGFTKVVESVDPEKWDAQSPCTEWDARGVVEHVIETQNDWILKPLGVQTERQENVVARWKATDAALDKALSSDDALDRDVQGPMGDTTVRSLIQPLTSDLLMHSWDVGRAVGIDVELDPEVAAAALEMGEQAGEGLQASGMFGPPVPVADDATVADRMLGVFGRDPEWKAPG